MKSPGSNHYATLGLHQNCSDAQIRDAYRLLARQLHPDVNGGSREAVAQTQALNAAYEILGDPTTRHEYDRELCSNQKAVSKEARTRNLTKEVMLRIEEFFRGTRLEVHIDEPGNPDGPEHYELIIPPETSPGSRIKIERIGGGFLHVRVKARPDFRFKARGSDLRCDLKISYQRAQLGGSESLRGPSGDHLRILIPAQVSRGETIRIPGGGLPTSRNGRGDLLVRIQYTPKVEIRRTRFR